MECLIGKFHNNHLFSFVFLLYQVNFDNVIAAIKGGTHVDHVTNQITTHVMNVVYKKNKNENLKAHNVKNYLQGPEVLL